MSWTWYAWAAIALATVVGCEQPPASENDTSQPTLSITKWTDKSELFVEFPALVAGQQTPFAAHLTDLKTFRPVSGDRVTVSLESRDGGKVSADADEPVVPGIYRPVITPKQPGQYQLIFQRSREGDGVYDIIRAGEVEVAPKDTSFSMQEEEPNGTGITFLKEQQWRMDFATALVAERDLAMSLTLNAEIRPRAAGQANVITPITGRVLAVKEGVPVPGQKVAAGHPLALILPLPTKGRAELESQLRTARSQREAALKELARVRELYQDRIVPAKRLEKAREEATVQAARLDAAKAELALLEMNQTVTAESLPASLEKFALRSPISGTVIKTNLIPGASVRAGQDLFTIVDLEKVWIEGRLFESDMGRLSGVGDVVFTAPSLPAPLVFDESNAKLVTLGSVVDPVSRSLPLIVEVANPKDRLKIGMHGQMAVSTGRSLRALTIPTSAVVEDKGIPVAFVHTGGETFERRELTLGMESRGYIQVIGGLTEGERVVTRGAYRVHLASLSTELPAHGHAH